MSFLIHWAFQDDENVKCEAPPGFPYNVYGAAGLVGFDGNPFVCGGSAVAEEMNRAQCYKKCSAFIYNFCSYQSVCTWQAYMAYSNICG